MDEFEVNHVHDIYANPNCTSHFSEHKHQKPWSLVKNFLNDLEPYSLVGDIGCGNGKYLNINQKLVSLGCDRSSYLLNQAFDRHETSHLLLSDNLSLPIRNGIFDAVLSIGVLHHFSTKQRRIQALNELVRILQENGKLIICVWAMEQKSRKFLSQDVLVPLRPDAQIEYLTKKYLSNAELPQDFKIRKFPLSSHENTFNNKVASNEKRFYHVFKENELDELINENINNLNIYKSFYNHGNWCVCARKCS